MWIAERSVPVGAPPPARMPARFAPVGGPPTTLTRDHGDRVIRRLVHAWLALLCLLLPHDAKTIVISNKRIIVWFIFRMKSFFKNSYFFIL